MTSERMKQYFDALRRVELQELNSKLEGSLLDCNSIRQFAIDGILVRSQFLDASHVDELEAACQRLEDLVQDEQTSYLDFNLEASVGGWKSQGRKTICHLGKLRKVMNLLDHGRQFCDLATHPAVVSIVSGLLGSGFQLHSKGFLMCKPPGVSTEKPWHQDSAYFRDVEEVVTIWIALQDTDESNGCLFALPGSHRLGLLEHIHEEAQLDPALLALDKSRAVLVKRGGICMMHKHTVHYSGFNNSLKNRRAIILRYKQVSSHISAEIWSNKDSIPAPMQDDQRQASLSQSDTLKPGDLSANTSAIRISDSLALGEEIGQIEKAHLIICRIFRQQAATQGSAFIDMGTDYCYPFYDKYRPTQNALQALKDNVTAAQHYPSSFGLEGLRSAFQSFMASMFGVRLRQKEEIMINTGASQAFDAMSRALSGQYVLLPALALPTVGTIAVANGAKLIRLPCEFSSGMVDLSAAQQIVNLLPQKSIKFLYLNSPVNPSGHVAELAFLELLVEFAIRNSITILHDMDSWCTRHDNSRSHNILEIPGAMECSISVLSISKEFGLPGLRVGLLAGNEVIIDAIRRHNSTFAVMIPEVCQYAALAALRAFDLSVHQAEVNRPITIILHRTIKGWRSLGWPVDEIHTPTAGFKYLVSVPPQVQSQGPFNGLELLDFFIASRAYVKLSTSRSFNPQDFRYIRMVLMQNVREVDELFDRLKGIGIYYNMTLPENIADEYARFLKEHVSSDF